MRSSPRPLSAGLSAALCGAVLGAFAFMGPQPKAPRKPDRALTLVTVAAADDSDEAQRAAEEAKALPPTKPAAVPPPAPAAAPPVVAPVAIEPPRVPPVHLRGPVPVPAASQPVAASAPAQPPVRAPDPAGTAGPISSTPSRARAGPDGKADRARGGAYAARVRRWLLAHKIYPKGARMRRQEGIVQVRFVLDRHGGLVEGRVVGTSGSDLLDREGLAMLSRAAPYPSPPDEVPGDRIEFTAAIEFQLRS